MHPPEVFLERAAECERMAKFTRDENRPPVGRIISHKSVAVCRISVAVYRIDGSRL
jgi:hypothetical protein